MTFRDIPHELGGEGHKFGLPEAPLARTDHLKRRYDPVVDQLTKKLMRSGKLSYAQRVWDLGTIYEMCLNFLITILGRFRYSRYTPHCSSTPEQIFQTWTSVAAQRGSYQFTAALTYKIFDRRFRFSGATDQDSTREGHGRRRKVITDTGADRNQVEEKDGHGLDRGKFGQENGNEAGRSSGEGDHRCRRGHQFCMGQKAAPP
jgi:hypothetical protein